MELKLIHTVKKETMTLKSYEIGRYAVLLIEHESGFKNVTVRGEKSDYLPEIYCEYDADGHLSEFRVQTTSYGALGAGEIKKVVAGLEEAARVAEVLNEELVNKEEQR